MKIGDLVKYTDRSYEDDPDLDLDPRGEGGFIGVITGCPRYGVVTVLHNNEKIYEQGCAVYISLLEILYSTDN